MKKSIKFDIEKSEKLFPIFGSRKKQYTHLTDEMKRILVKECIECGSQEEFFDKLFKNYKDIHVSEAMNKPDGWKVFKYNVGKNDEPVPIYKWMVEPIIVEKELTLEQEMLNFVFWLDNKTVKTFKQ